MPNWCENVARILAPDENMAARVEDAFRRGELFGEFIPIPGDDPDWYAKRNGGWGTKWNPVADDGTVWREGCEVEISFLTAWEPPLAFYDHLLGLGYSVDAEWLEASMQFCGFKTGRSVTHCRFEELADIPERVVTAFGAEYVEGIFDWADGDVGAEAPVAPEQRPIADMEDAEVALEIKQRVAGIFLARLRAEMPDKRHWLEANGLVLVTEVAAGHEVRCDIGGVEAVSPEEWRADLAKMRDQAREAERA